MEIKFTVRPEDEQPLTAWAKDERRDADQQVAALIDQLLQARRAKSDPTVPRRTRRSRTNGTHTLVTAQ